MTKKEQSEIWRDGKEKIVRVQTVGPFDEKTARWVLDETRKMAEKYGNEINWIIDLTLMTQASSKARKLLVEASRHPSIRKYAFFRASIFIRTVANFVLAAAGQKNARHFETGEDALKWLNEGD